MGKKVKVSFEDNDLRQFNTESTKLIKATTEEDKMVQNLFVTQSKEAMSDFEKEKDSEIETLVGSKI